MVWNHQKDRLQRLIEHDTGIVRVRVPALDDFAQKRAREIRAELDPHSTDTPSHRGYIPGDPTTSPNWDSYWPDLPDDVHAFGENLTWNYNFKDPVKAAQNYTTSSGLLVGWKNSPAHWKNEMNTTYKRIGLGIARKVLDGDRDNPLEWRWYFVAIFTD
jgi:hypothetical protein